MNSENPSNPTGSPAEPARRKSKFSRAIVVSSCCIIFAGCISLLLVMSSARRNAAEQNLVKEAATSPSANITALKIPEAPSATSVERQQVKPDRAVPGIPHPLRKGLLKPVAGISAHRKLSAKHTTHEFGGQSSPNHASTLAASQGVFSRSPLPPTVQKSLPVFSIVSEPKIIKEQAQDTYQSVEAARRPSAALPDAQQRPPQTNSSEQISKDSTVAPAESRVDLANLPQEKGPEFRAGVETTKLTTATTIAPPGVVGKSTALQQPQLSLRVEISAPDAVVPSEFRGDVRNLPQSITTEERKQFSRPLELEIELPTTKKPLPGAQPEILTQLPGPLAAVPAPTISFDGMNFNTNGAGHPPDTVGDVGPNHFVQAVNTSIGIYNKTTGAAFSTFTFSALWLGATTGTPCDTTHRGDPTVIYSPQKDRFIVADFSWTNLQDGPYYECIAVSKTSDPVTGGWWLYGVRADDAAHPWLPDYPKMGIWPDGLYMTANMFDCTNASCSTNVYKEVRAYAFNIVDLVNGAALRSVVVDTSSSNFSLLPSNYRGMPPPVGTPNYMVEEDSASFAWDVFKFHVDYTTPANSTFSGPTQVIQTPYTLAAATVPEPAGNDTDTLRNRLMMQAQYRSIGGVESLWVNHTTGTASASTPTGIQWAQINVTGGTINTTPVQQQIFNNGADGLNRFAGSLAVDRIGNMILGYTASSLTIAPDIRYAGRLKTDPLSQLPQTETTMLPGVTRSVQTGTCGSTCTRWGDYSAMTVDPVDGCTFWYTNMYFPVAGLNWVTRIGSVRFPAPTCAPIAFTDNPLVVQVTTAKAQHIIELRQAVDALRAVAGLGPAPWTDPALVSFSTSIKAVHILELRAFLENAAALLGYPAGTYTDPALSTGFVIKLVHIEELRQRIRTIAGG